MVHSGGVYIHRHFRFRILFGNEAMRKIHGNFYYLISIDEAFEEWQIYYARVMRIWDYDFIIKPASFETFCKALVKLGYRFYWKEVLMRIVKVGTICNCERCEHKWRARGKNNSTKSEVKICPKCKSPYWDQPRAETVKQNWWRKVGIKWES